VAAPNFVWTWREFVEVPSWCGSTRVARELEQERVLVRPHHLTHVWLEARRDDDLAINRAKRMALAREFGDYLLCRRHGLENVRAVVILRLSKARVNLALLGR
jgi:hypothetical protein